MTPSDIDHRFTHHPPTAIKVERHESVRADAKALAHRLNETLPEGREKSLAITHLEEVVFWANAAIARSYE